MAMAPSWSNIGGGLTDLYNQRENFTIVKEKMKRMCVFG
jgi:hypothetical protein